MSGGIDVRVAEAGSGTADLTAAINRLAAAADSLAASADRSAASTRNVGQAASQASQGFGLLQSAMSNLQGSFGMLSGAAGGLLTYLSTQKVIEYADSFTNVQNRLRLVSTSTADLTAKTQEVYDIAQKTRSGFDDTAKVYQRLQQSMQNVNGVSSTTGQLLTTINQAMQLGGASTQAASGAMEQFQQALSRGVLRGQEFNSVMTGAPGLALAIADGLGKPITALKNMADQGQLTAQVVINALGKAGPEVAKAFAQSTPTIASAFTYLQNAMTMYIGTAAQGNTSTNLLRQGIIALGDNLNIVIPIATVFAGLMLFAQIYSGIAAIGQLVLALAQLTVGFATLAAAAIMNPVFWTVLAGVIAGVVVAFTLWGNSIAETTSKIPILGSAVNALNNAINGKKSATQAGTEADKAATKATDDLFQKLGNYIGQAQKAAGAAGQHTAAMQANAVQMAVTGTAVNAFGEKLETLQQAHARWAAEAKVVSDAMKEQQQEANALNSADAQLLLSQNGVNDAWLKAQMALQGLNPEMDKFGESAKNLASEAGALGANIGTFTQEAINSNAALSNLDKVAASASSAVSSLGASFRSAGNDAQFFAIQSQDANTVAGQIGTKGTLSGMNFDDNIIPLGYGGNGSNTYMQSDIDRIRQQQINAEADYQAKIKKMQDQATAAANQKYGLTDQTTTSVAANTNTASVTGSLSSRSTTSGVSAGSGAAQYVANSSSLIPNAAPTNPYATPGQYTPNTVQSGGPAYEVPDPNPSYTSSANPVVGSLGGTWSRQPISITIKADDYDQFNRSGRQSAQDIANRIAAA